MWRDYLVSDPQVCGGHLCGKGTRVLVTVILDNLAEGNTREEILRSYPSLTPEHLDATLPSWRAKKPCCLSARNEIQDRRKPTRRGR